MVLLDHPDRFHKSRPPPGHPASVRWLNGAPSYPPCIGSRTSFLPKRTPIESPSRLRRCRTSRRPNPGPAQVKTPVGFDPCQPTPPESFDLLKLTRLLSIPSKAHNPGQIRVPCRCQTKPEKIVGVLPPFGFSTIRKSHEMSGFPRSYRGSSGGSF